MFLDINEIGEEPVSFDRALDLPVLTVEGTEAPVSDARLRGAAGRGDGCIEFRARLDARVRLRCSRCLESFPAPVTADFGLSIVGEGVEFGAGETELRTEDVTLFYAKNGKVDYRVVAEEQIYLNLPLKPVCRTDCQGLCPSCGVQRSRVACDCRQEVPDPRFAGLLELKEELKNR